LFADALPEEPRRTVAAAETDDQFFSRNLNVIEEKIVATWPNDPSNAIILFSPGGTAKVGGLTTRFVHKDNDGLFVEVDLRVYGLSALLKVAHKFTDRCFVHIEPVRNQVMYIRFRTKNSDTPLESIAGEFCNEILDQRLREVVAQESEPTRNLIMAHALSRVGLFDADLETPPDNGPPPS
jgi:His-Xaa-Ser system protein HxsD